MTIKGAAITCIIVVMYLLLCSWRFERLDEAEESTNETLVINVK